MGLLDDAIREHLDLKRRRGADPTEIERAEREALGPVRREPLAAEASGSERLEPVGEPLDIGVLGEHGLREDELDELEPDAEPETRHSGGARSLFGRFRRGGGDHPTDEPPEADLGLAGGGGPEPLAPDDSAALPEEAGWDETGHDEDEYEYEYGFEDVDEFETRIHEQPGQGTVPFRPPSEWHEAEPGDAPAAPGAAAEGRFSPDEEAPPQPPPHRAEAHPPSVAPPPSIPGDAPLTPAPAPPRPERPIGEEPEQDEEDVLEETPEFLQDTPDHDRLWFEQRPPRDFDFDG